ncbi:YlqD family protein [Metabacillus sp. KIGAM252]|uniref:YlqD family protein n=1 Tax=Metabacillus flavus TaxID=2823519 RepID=A0ABS5LDZ9_9BACI|nr:YlqD family protein [Metabacillus flavus]
MKIMQTVSVMQVLTENSKNKLLDGFNSNREQLLRECDQLYFQLKKLEKTNISIEMRQQYKKEIEKRKDKIKMVDFQIDQLNTLPLGSELKEKEVQAIVELEEGDSWTSSINERSIIVTDGIITEIR